MLKLKLKKYNEIVIFLFFGGTMKKIIKLLLLILISLSVYFIYQETNHKKVRILCLGDALSLGINSFGIKDYGYLDRIKDYYHTKNIQATIISKYSREDLTIQEVMDKINTIPEYKRELKEANYLILNLGYNDLMYKLSLDENKTQSSLKEDVKEIEENYFHLIEEIRKYYRNPIIVIGYHTSTLEDYYKNKGIRELNEILKNTPNSIYIDTDELLKPEAKYFSNPNSYYPNSIGYQAIAKKIIRKTLEK